MTVGQSLDRDNSSSALRFMHVGVVVAVINDVIVDAVDSSPAGDASACL